jgi:hypothetical protein
MLKRPADSCNIELSECEQSLEGVLASGSKLAAKFSSDTVSGLLA